MKYVGCFLLFSINAMAGIPSASETRASMLAAKKERIDNCKLEWRSVLESNIKNAAHELNCGTTISLDSCISPSKVMKELAKKGYDVQYVDNSAGRDFLIIGWCKK